MSFARHDVPDVTIKYIDPADATVAAGLIPAMVTGWREKPEPFGKPVRLSPKELRRADRSHPDWPFTIIARRDVANGGFTVAAIDLNTLKPLFDCATERAETREGISGAARQVCRWLDKTGLSTRMTSASRRSHGKHMRLVPEGSG